MRAHIYGTGTEDGMMLIGSSGEMRALADRLVQGMSGIQADSGQQWPPEIACCEVDGTPFKVSFHLESGRGVPPTNVVPRTSTMIWFWGLVPFALLGLVVAVRWVAHAF